MKRPTDFKCQNCNHKFEVWVESSVKQCDCPLCESLAVKQIGAPKCFQNTTGKSPSASNRPTK